MASRAQEMIQEIVAKYRQAGEEWPASSKMLAGWAIRKGLWNAQRHSLIELAAHDFADAMRDEYFTDPQGRRVRQKHAIRVTRELPSGKHEQLVLWVDIATASPDQMESAFGLRRLQVLGDCRQLKLDVDSYNDNNPHHAHIQLCLDFTEDVAELEQPASYAGVS